MLVQSLVILYLPSPGVSASLKSLCAFHDFFSFFLFCLFFPGLPQAFSENPSDACRGQHGSA